MPRVSRAALRRGILALLLKELRENWPYPLLCWLLWIALALLYSQFAREDLHKEINILASPLIQIPTALTAGALGLWIGIGSTFRQRDPDQWALLIHRPLSRSHLFLGRLLGGTALYTLATGLPFALLILLAATPAGGAFFEWHMILPTAADFLTGFLCYLAGFLVGDRKAFILGSKALPILLAIALFYADFLLPRFSWFLAVAALAAMLFLLADWGSALSHGYRLPRAAPLPARLALRTLFTLAFLPIVFAATLPFWSAFVPPADNPYSPTLGTPDRPVTRTTYGVTPDGILFQQTWTYENGKRTLTDPTDLQGKPLPPLPSTPPTRQVYLSFDRPFPLPYHNINSQILVQHVQSPDRLTTQTWYFVYPAGLAFGYDDQSHAFLGTLGQSGFAPPGAPPATPFDARHQLLDDTFAYPNGLFSIDFTARTVTPIWQPPPGERLLDIYNQPGPVPPLWRARTTGPDDPWQIFITDKSLHVYDALSPAITLVSLPLQQPLTPGTRLIQLSDHHGWALESYAPFRVVGDHQETPETFILYDADGRLLSSRTLTTVLHASPLSPLYLRWIDIRQAKRGLLTGIMAPIAGALPVVKDLCRDLDVPDDAVERYQSAPWFNAALLAAAATVALLTLALTILYRTPWKPAWVLAALLLGPAIPLTLLATHSLPPPPPHPAPKPTPTTILT